MAAMRLEKQFLPAVQLELFTIAFMTQPHPKLIFSVTVNIVQ